MRDGFDAVPVVVDLENPPAVGGLPPAGETIQEYCRRHRCLLAPVSEEVWAQLQKGESGPVYIRAGRELGGGLVDLVIRAPEPKPACAKCGDAGKIHFINSHPEDYEPPVDCDCGA